ncbi:MAG: hypothetical protein RLZZ116_2531 [Planctomycetota bacterium]|jgi:hypothetical protein
MHGKLMAVVAGFGVAVVAASASAQTGWPGIVCWGNNVYAQCTVPAGLGAVASVAAGEYHTVALKDDGSIACWGYNGHGQCNVPAGLGTVASIAAGYYHTVALKADGSIACWGENGTGQCNVPAGLGTVLSVAAGGHHSVALRQDGSVACWGRNNYGQCNVPAGLGTVQSVTAGFYHTAALKADGSAACWGYNGNGECNVPADLGTATAIAGGGNHTIALRSDGFVRCWGYNYYGQCNVPAGLGAVQSVAAGVLHTVALKADGSVACWGYNGYGQCNVPAGLGTVLSVAAGGYHTVVLPANPLPVRSASPDGSSEQLYASIQDAANLSPQGWLIEATPAATGGFSVSGRFIRGIADLTIPSSVYLYSNSRLIAEGRINIGTAGTGDTSFIQSNLTDSAGPSIVVGALSSPLRTVATSATELSGQANLFNYPFVSTAHRLLLRGGIFSSNPDQTPREARFLTCTAPEYATVTPCLEFGPQSVIDLPPGNKIISNGPTTTLIGGLATLRNGSTIETDADLAIGGSMRIPVGNAVSLSVDRVTVADPALSIRSGGELVVEFGSSMQIAAPAKASVTGSLTVDQDALFSLLGGADLLQVEPRGDARCFGGSIRADEMVLMGAPVGSADAGGRLVGVNALIDVDTVRVRGGSANLANSSLVGNLVTEPREGGSAAPSTIAASGQLFGNISNTAGKLISIGDLVVVGNVANSQGSQILAQVGVLYITGNLVNNGIVFGNVITAPGYQGGGTGGTQVGDGIRVAGSVEVGPAGELRFVEDLWKFSVCGNMTLACASDDVRFNGAKLSLDGCEGTTQTFEATSRDLGCVASAFSGEETQVSLIGELDVVSGATVSLVDNFNNAPGKDAEVVYARGLTVQPGATLLTNGIKVVTRNALIQGTVDNPANICVVPDVPDPDVNGDGFVNGIDLAFILTYWGSSAPIADLNDDGIVGGADLTIVLSGWTG